MTHPSNNLRNLKRRVARARRFPENTCGASRSVHLLADMFLTYGDATGFDRRDAASAMLSVLESLWKARTELRKLRGR